MSPEAQERKKTTLARFEYLVEDGFEQYEEPLKHLLEQPDSFWESMVDIRQATKKMQKKA